MSLRLKRNLPTILLLLGILASLAFFFGSQPVIAYTLNAVDLSTVEPLTGAGSSTGSLASSFLSSAKETLTGLQAQPATGGSLNTLLTLAAG